MYFVRTVEAHGTITLLRKLNRRGDAQESQHPHPSLREGGGTPEVLFDNEGWATPPITNGQSLQKAWIPLPGGAQAVYTNSSNGVSLAITSTNGWGAHDWPTANFQERGLCTDGEPYAEAGNHIGNLPGSATRAGLYDFMDCELSGGRRWISPDPAGMSAADPTNPQTWNRYAYVGNNPLSYIDPQGLEWVLRFDFWYHFGPSSSIPLSSILYIPQQPSGLPPQGGGASHESNNGTPANNGTLGCIVKGVQSAFPGSVVTTGLPTGEVGGHWNYSLQMQFSSQDAASAFRSTYITASSGFPPPARFGPGNLHCI